METITVNNKSFNIVKLLGKGKGGYSYLADDGNRQYVVKKIHHEPCDYYTFGNKIEAELNDYRRLCDAGIRIPHMIDIDTENETILKEYIEGINQNDNIKKAFCILDLYGLYWSQELLDEIYLLPSKPDEGVFVYIQTLRPACLNLRNMFRFSACPGAIRQGRTHSNPRKVSAQAFAE